MKGPPVFGERDAYGYPLDISVMIQDAIIAIITFIIMGNPAPAEIF